MSFDFILISNVHVVFCKLPNEGGQVTRVGLYFFG